MTTTSSRPERRCRRCGATSGLRLLPLGPLTLAGPTWECVDGCPPAKLDLDAIEILANAADPGPWTAHPDGLVWAERIGDPVSGSVEQANADFIAAARAAVPALIAEVRRHRAALVDDQHHVIEFHPVSWKLHHPRVCLPNPAECPVWLVALQDVGKFEALGGIPPGRYECEVNGLGDRLLILDRIDVPEATNG